jgi:hypothetical protein
MLGGQGASRANVRGGLGALQRDWNHEEESSRCNTHHADQAMMAVPKKQGEVCSPKNVRADALMASRKSSSSLSMAICSVRVISQASGGDMNALG